MDPFTAAGGATKVALQVLTGRKRPVLEVYSNLRHRIGTEEVYSTESPLTEKITEHRHRPQDIFIEFVLTNIGSIRAENIRLAILGGFSKNFPRKPLSTMPIFSGKQIDQLAPAQSFPLFLLDQDDLLVYPDGGGRPSGTKQEGFSIVAEYDAPASGVNRVMRTAARFRKKRQFTMRFTFDPTLYDGLDLPPAEYA
jgi:hypothetical protein